MGTQVLMLLPVHRSTYMFLWHPFPWSFPSNPCAVTENHSLRPNVAFCFYLQVRIRIWRMMPQVSAYLHCLLIHILFPVSVCWAVSCISPWRRDVHMQYTCTQTQVLSWCGVLNFLFLGYPPATNFVFMSFNAYMYMGNVLPQSLWIALGVSRLCNHKYWIKEFKSMKSIWFAECLIFGLLLNVCASWP